VGPRGSANAELSGLHTSDGQDTRSPKPPQLHVPDPNGADPRGRHQRAGPSAENVYNEAEVRAVTHPRLVNEEPVYLRTTRSHTIQLTACTRTPHRRFLASEGEGVPPPVPLMRMAISSPTVAASNAHCPSRLARLQSTTGCGSRRSLAVVVTRGEVVTMRRGRGSDRSHLWIPHLLLTPTIRCLHLHPMVIPHCPFFISL
jgi:hypothetical protein